MVCASTFMSAGYSVFFSLSEFLLTHSGFATLLFMGRSAECCRCVLQFSCWDCVPGYRRLYLLSCMFTCTSCWISFITRARISRIHRLAGRPYNDIWILFGISYAIRLLHFDTSVGALFLGVLSTSLSCVGISFWSLRLLGERPIVFHFPRCQFRDVAQGSDRMIRLCSSSGALISSQAFIFGPSFVSETGFITIVIVCDPLHLSTFMNSLSK